MKISTDNSVIRQNTSDIEALRLIKEAGFDGIDYSFYNSSGENDLLAWDDARREELAEKIKDEAKKLGLEFPQSHAELKYTYETIEADPEHPMYRRIIRSMEYASRIGCKRIVIHDMRCPNDMDDETADRLNIEFMRSFLPYAEKFQLKIGIENLFKREKGCNYYYGRHHTAEWMNRFTERLGSDIFEVCIDIGHAEICGTPSYNLIRGITPGKFTMMHVQDTDFLSDKHWLPYIGNHDWDKITEALAESDYKGFMNLEVLNFYKRFTPDLYPGALKLAADVARHLADEVDSKRNRH